MKLNVYESMALKVIGALVTFATTIGFAFGLWIGNIF